MLLSLKGKRGLIIGIANENSIAYGCAKLMQQAGAELVASCANEKAVKFVAPHTEALGITLHTCDVQNHDEMAALVDRAVAQLGGLDFVVHSVAWAPLADLHGKVLDSSAEGFAQAMTISCHSLAHLTRLCAPHMNKGGAIVTMSYLGSVQAVPHYGIMGPVKAALESLVRYLAVDVGTQNIRVHAVSPGPIMTRAASGIAHFDDLLTQAEEKAPLQRLVRLEEIAALTAFLCSDAASGMTGQTIYVDAGCHLTA